VHKYLQCVSKKGYYPTINDNFNNSSSNFWYKYCWVNMPLKGGLIYHLTCLSTHLTFGNFKILKIMISLKLQISVMVSIAMSTMGMTELTFVVPGTKVNGQYYRDVLLSQQMLPAIKHTASDTFVFQQENAPSHCARTPLNSYSSKHRTSLVLISGHQAAQTWI